MDKDQIIGLVLIVLGLYSVIRFRYNARTSLKDRLEIANKLSFGKSKKEMKPADILFAQFMYLFIGTIFIIVGLAKIFNF